MVPIDQVVFFIAETQSPHQPAMRSGGENRRGKASIGSALLRALCDSALRTNTSDLAVDREVGTLLVRAKFLPRFFTHHRRLPFGLPDDAHIGLSHSGDLSHPLLYFF